MLKVLRVTWIYPAYLSLFYARMPHLAVASYNDQIQQLNRDAFGWGDAWKPALEPLGYEMTDLMVNNLSALRAWDAEFGSGTGTRAPRDILLDQIRLIRPDVLWFDHYDAILLRQIKEGNPSIRLVMGWVGSSVPETDAYRDMDLILSCAPESVETFVDSGKRAFHLNHAFDPRICIRLKPRRPRQEIVFVGSVIRRKSFHLYRDSFLGKIISRSPVYIATPEYALTFRQLAGFLKRLAVYEFRQAIGNLLSEPNATSDDSTVNQMRPRFPISKKLLPYLKPPLFGLEMYQFLRDAAGCLNIHADSSPAFASNMRLFEVPGVGGCLITDYKRNLSTLFEVESEIVSYKSADECIEKIEWLERHPEERDRIAIAGRERIFREHTFGHRARELDDIIRAHLKAS